ncbi:MAG: AMP-binding protein [Myxococcota bacterium]|nr:AMP-binding protein [Myxococcota bacterium]
MAHVVSNSDILPGAWRFARALDAAGVDRRGAVAALLPNHVEYLWSYRGATWSGRRFTPMSWRWTPEDVDYVVGNCEADALVAHIQFADAAIAAAHHVSEERRFVVGGDIPGFRPFSDIEAFSSDTYEQPLAGVNMIYTSGTTGRPKGVMRNPPPESPPPTITCAAGVAMISAFLPEPDRNGTHLVVGPLYHSGPNTYCDGSIALGADIVLMEKFDAEEVLRLIEEHQIVSTFMVPTHMVRLLRLPKEVREKYDVSSIRLVCHGAAPNAPGTKRQMIDWWGPVLFEFYGATEGGGCMISSQEWLQKPGSVGRPRPDVEMKIVDDAGEEVAAGVEGTVSFALDDGNPFIYKGDAEKTQESRVGEGWFSVGDIGYVDEDGYLFLCDRRADVIISGGVNIYPAQIEAALLELPIVADCCVVGTPNDDFGEEVCAVVQLCEGANEAEAKAEIATHCRASLAGYQVPRNIDFDAALPRTEVGKLARRTIRARYWEGRERRI